MQKKENKGHLFFEILDKIIEKDSINAPKNPQNPLKNIINYYLPEYKEHTKSQKFMKRISSSLTGIIEDCAKEGEPPPFDSVFGMPLKRIPFKKLEYSYTQKIREKSNYMEFYAYIKENRPDEVERVISFYEGSVLNNSPSLLLKNKFNLHHQEPISGGGKDNPLNLKFLPTTEHKLTHQIISLQKNIKNREHLNSDIFIPTYDKIFLIPEEYNPEAISNDFLNYVQEFCAESVPSYARTKEMSNFQSITSPIKIR